MRRGAADTYVILWTKQMSANLQSLGVFQMMAALVEYHLDFCVVFGVAATGRRANVFLVGLQATAFGVCAFVEIGL